MYTQCPQCKAIYAISVKQLRAGLGEALCERCQIAFNALTTLATSEREAVPDQPPAIRIPALGTVASVDQASLRLPRMDRALNQLALPYQSSSQPADFAFWERAEKASFASRLFWLLGSIGLLALFSWQVSVYEGASMAKNIQLRPWLEQACQIFDCWLPAYRDVSRIEIIERELYPAPDGSDGFEFRLMMANQSERAQSFPAIKLGLMQDNGETIAERVFQPGEYLPEAFGDAAMASGQPVEIKLLLAAPRGEVGGFTFELM